MITHVLFDFDGTLVNTIDVAIHLLKELIKREGAEMNEKVKGKYNDDTCKFMHLLSICNHFIFILLKNIFLIWKLLKS